MAQTDHSTPTAHHLNLAEMVRRSLYGCNARVVGAAPALGTAPAPVQEPTRPTYMNDDAIIAEGHRQRREMLARRRAQQQLELALESAARVGVSVSTEQIVNLVTDTVDDVRRCARR